MAFAVSPIGGQLNLAPTILIAYDPGPLAFSYALLIFTNPFTSALTIRFDKHRIVLQFL